MSGAVLSTLDNVVKDFYLPIFQEKLAQREIEHACGSPFHLSFLDRDGQIFSRQMSVDAWDATLLARCKGCSSNDALNYASFRISGDALSRSRQGQDSFLQMLRMQLEKTWDCLEAHLIERHGCGDGVWSPEIAAEFSEWMTRRLTKGTLNSITLKHELEQRARMTMSKPWSFKRSQRLAEKIGFVSHREPFMYYQTLHPINYTTYTEADTLPAVMPLMPSVERMEDVFVFSLPEDHPLAMAA